MKSWVGWIASSLKCKSVRRLYKYCEQNPSILVICVWNSTLTVDVRQFYKSIFKILKISLDSYSMVGHIRNYEGSNYFRQRLILATLSRTTIKIKHIRIRDDEPGLRGKYYRSFTILHCIYFVMAHSVFPFGKPIPLVWCSWVGPRVGLRWVARWPLLSFWTLQLPVLRIIFYESHQSKIPLHMILISLPLQLSSYTLKPSTLQIPMAHL